MLVDNNLVHLPWGVHALLVGSITTLVAWLRARLQAAGWLVKLAPLVVVIVLCAGGLYAIFGTRYGEIFWKFFGTSAVDHGVALETISLILTFFISEYVYVTSRGFYQSLGSPVAQRLMFGPFIVLTAFAGIWCLLTLHEVFPHAIALSSFFLVFVIWDALLWWLPKKKQDGQLTDKGRITEQRVKDWLFRTDIPSLIAFIFLYKLISFVIPEVGFSSAPCDKLVCDEHRKLFEAGAVTVLMIFESWTWFLDLMTAFPEI